MNNLQKLQPLIFKPSLAKIHLSLLPATKIKKWELLFGVALIALLCYGMVEYSQSQAQLKQKKLKLSQLNYQQEVSKNKPATVNKEESAAIVEAIGKLNYAWDHAFKALEKARMSEVSILELSPNVQTRQLDIVAQTTSLQLMLEYIKKIKSLPFVSRVVLNSDEFQDNKQQPVLFHIKLTWF
jgi:hypothetical protein